jgi:hypothetical protein
MDGYLSFTRAGRGLMARRCRGSRSEYEQVDNAMRRGFLLLTDAALAHAIPGWAGSGIVEQLFPGGRPGAGVRLLYLYRRGCERNCRPGVVVIRHGGRAALLGELLYRYRGFTHDELERVTAVLKAHKLEESVDARMYYWASGFISSVLPDLAILPTVAFRLFETMLDIMEMRARIARGEASETGDALSTFSMPASWRSG